MRAGRAGRLALARGVRSGCTAFAGGRLPPMGRRWRQAKIKRILPPYFLPVWFMTANGRSVVIYHFGYITFLYTVLYGM